MPAGSRRLGQAVLTAVLGLLVAVVASCTLPAVANATMTATTSGQASTWSTLTVAAATGLGATAACGPIGSLSAKATLAWTPSTTSRMTSQVVLRRLGSTGVFSTVATLATTATGYVDSGLLVATTYNYEIRTTVNGFLADTAPASATTPTVCT